MLLRNSLDCMSMFDNCPICGNDSIGNGAGLLHMEGSTFRRTCKCGWQVFRKEKDNVLLPDVLQIMNIIENRHNDIYIGKWNDLHFKIAIDNDTRCAMEYELLEGSFDEDTIEMIANWILECMNS